MTFQDVQFPAVARAAHAGWVLEVQTLEELTSSSLPFDPAHWEGLEIYDSSGRSFVAEHVFAVGDTGVDAKLSERSDIALEDLRPQLACLAASRGHLDRRVRIYEARDLRGMIHALFDQGGQPSASPNRDPLRGSR